VKYSIEMTKKKILFLLHTPPPVHGSSVVGESIKNSPVINEAFECNYINLGTSRTVDEIGKKPLIKTLRYFSILWQVLVQLIRFKPQLCYLAITAKGTAFFKDVFVVFLVKLFGVKLIYHFHNKGIASVQHKPLYHFMYKRVFKKAEVILLSKHLYYDIQKYVPENRVHYCPNGIPDIKHKPENRVKEENAQAVEILFLSNLIESKGVFVLLEDCSILKQKNLVFHCTCVGGVGDVNALQFQEKVKKLGLRDHASYAGRKYGQEKEEAFSKADIFAFPTFYHNECFPLVLLEAMQHRLPTISTFEGGIRSIVDDGKTGFLIPQKNAHSVAEKLEILIQNPAMRQQMGAAGRKKYEQEFTLNKFEERLKGILKEIVNE
jgi:glycosyltransferase involved in cell wall biosynthesis